MDGQTILHADLNCFYASVEMNEHPELRGKAIAVCGSTEDRHGIVLTASYPAKRRGVKTGMANWEARQACPGLICVSPNYELYLHYSRIVRSIYRDYSDRVEPFGMDEAWISVDEGEGMEETGLQTAETIRRRVREETGLTVSVGVSFSKIFAKLGSDMKKPDAVTVITKENFHRKVWPLPVQELLYVGRATGRKLRALNIHTIGDLAVTPPEVLDRNLGKNGVMLWQFARGEDHAAVMPYGYQPPIQSVGHGVTAVKDLETEYEVWLVLLELAQDVGHRLRADGLMAKAVEVTVKDCDLFCRQFQAPLPASSRSPLELAQAGFALFRRRYGWEKPVRALTIRGIRLIAEDTPCQTDLFLDFRRHEKQRKLDDAVDEIRRRFGANAVHAASLMHDLKMAQDRCEIVTMPGLMYS